MPRQPKQPKIARRRTGKITISLRLSPETKARLDKAAAHFELDSFSAYAEQAILERLERDKITNQPLQRKKS
jgi:predicted transcriptional regulator